MKRLLGLSLLLIGLGLNAQVTQNLTIPKNPRIGLSLAGGGAKGFAHVGALKIIDSLGIKIDYVSGTSMGSIVGGLYAAGYSASDIEKIVNDTDFIDLLMNDKTRKEAPIFNKNNDKYLLNIPIKDGKINFLPKAISSGQNNIYMLKELFKNVANIKDFSKFPIPFMCVATNLETGKVKYFEEGDIVSSIMASSAFPSLLDPVKIGDSLYIDGAMTINYPSQPLKDKGIDIVIGVDLSQPLATRENLNSALDILNQVIDYSIQKETLKQYNYTDINIHPDLKGYSSTSYNDKNKIITLGFEETKKYIDVLKGLPKVTTPLLRAPYNPIYSNVYKIDSLHLENNKIFNSGYIRGKMNLKLPSMQTYGSINKMVNKLYSTNNYKLITYDINNSGENNTLNLKVTEDENRYFLKLGLHYDDVFNTGLLLNATAKRLLFRNSILSADVIVGTKPRYYFNYFVDNGYIPGFGLYASGMSLDLKNDNGGIYRTWNWFHNEAFIQSIFKDRYSIGGGIALDFFESKFNKIKDNEQSFLNPFVFIKSDNRDNKDFPTKGFSLDARATMIDLLKNKEAKKPIQIRAKFDINIPFGKMLTYQLKAFAGLTFGQELNEYYKYRAGALFDQELGNFVPFKGYQFGSTASDNLFAISNHLQINVYKSYFVTPHFNIMNPFDSQVEDFIKVKHTSMGLTLGYNSPVGQVKIDFSQPLREDKKGMLSVILGHWF